MSLPLITTKREEAQECVALINDSLEHKIYGEFIAVSPRNGGFNCVFMLKSKAIPANQASSNDFAMEYSTKTYQLLEDSSEFTFQIDVTLIQSCVLTDSIDQFLQLADNILRDVSSTSIVDVATRIKSIAQSRTKYAAETAIDPKELTLNKLLVQIIAPVATDLGYIITTNSPKGSDETVGHFSRFSSSRPDLALYSKDHHCGFFFNKKRRSLTRRQTRRQIKRQTRRHTRSGFLSTVLRCISIGRKKVMYLRRNNRSKVIECYKVSTISACRRNGEIGW